MFIAASKETLNYILQYSKHINFRYPCKSYVESFLYNIIAVVQFLASFNIIRKENAKQGIWNRECKTELVY